MQDWRTVTSLTPRAVASPTPRAISSLIPLAVAGVSVAIDQVTKTVAQDALQDGPISVLPGFRLSLTYNSGAAFSVGTGRSGIFTVLASVTVLALIAYSVWSAQSVSRRVMFGLIIGGAGGNLFDRLLRGNGGRVIDFMEFTPRIGDFSWPVFNVADVSLFFGVVLMLVLTFREERSARHSQ